MIILTKSNIAYISPEYLVYSGNLGSLMLHRDIYIVDNPSRGVDRPGYKVYIRGLSTPATNYEPLWRELAMEFPTLEAAKNWVDIHKYVLGEAVAHAH